MCDICFCPGKIRIAGIHANQKWFMPIQMNSRNCQSSSLDKITYCESCFKKYSNEMQELQFYLNQSQMSDNKNYCHWNCDEFKDSSVIFNGMRISIVNAGTLYRYKLQSFTKTSMTIGLPENTFYMMVIENCDKYMDTKMNIENIMHGDQYNFYDPASKKNSLVIPFMNYSSDLVFNEADDDKNIITFTLNKWIEHMKDNCRFYGLNNSIEFKIKLVRDDNENDKMRELMEKYDSIDTHTKKIIITDNFI